MGHRDVPGTFCPDHNEHGHNISHNNDVPQHMHFGYVGVPDPNRFAYPVRPNWNHSTMSGGYSYTHHNNGFQHHQLNAAPIHHPYPPLPAVPAFPSGHVYPSSSSNNDPPGFYRDGPSYDGLRMGGRGSSKRKSCAVSESANRFDGAGSSSSGQMYPDFVQGATRNVRRRYACDVESGTTPCSSMQFPCPAIHPISHSGSLDSTHWTASSVYPSWSHSHMPAAPGNHSWSHSHMPYAATGNISWNHSNMTSDASGMVPVAGLSNSNQGSNVALCGSTSTNLPSEARGYRNHSHGSRNPFGHHNSSENLTIPMQVVHSFSQQFPAPSRNTNNASGAGPSHNYPQIMSGNYSLTRLRRPFHREVFVPTSRNGGPRILYERCRFMPGDISGPNGPLSEGFMNEDQSAMEGFHEVFDQHSDMRLDVDRMTYEELLDLGERIGEVCTGLSDDAVSKCLIEVVRYSSTDHEQDEESCPICLEEYKNTDSVGKLSGCGHGYHSSCIKKWLSMKNSCPICKSPVLAAENIDDKGETQC
ncbi:unnamed protein product [Rhodiola kirilowii]